MDGRRPGSESGLIGAPSQEVRDTRLLPPGADSVFMHSLRSSCSFGEFIVNGEAGCTLCSQARVLKALIPVARGYGLKVYECAGCRSSLLLVTRVAKLSMLKKTRAKSSRRKKLKVTDAALKQARRLARPTA